MSCGGDRIEEGQVRRDDKFGQYTVVSVDGQQCTIQWDSGEIELWLSSAPLLGDSLIGKVHVTAATKDNAAAFLRKEDEEWREWCQMRNRGDERDAWD